MLAVARLIAILLATASLGAAPTPAVAILSLSPRVGFEPLSVAVKYRIEPHPDNRSVCLVWSDSHSCRDLDGANERRTYDLVLKDLPADRYTFTVAILRKDGATFRASERFCVLSRREETTTCEGEL